MDARTTRRPARIAHDLEPLLVPTPLLDIETDSIRALVAARGWRRLDPVARIGAVYDFVRNEIAFGYNADDDIAASAVLADGYGQCNTKATLLMALLRAVDVPCRFHAATIHKRLQRGVVTGVVYRLAPEQILHSWVEVLVAGEWKRLEGVILDDDYLDGLRCRLGHPAGRVVGYAAGTDDLRRPAVEWTGDHTEIQMAGVQRELGVFDDPDAYYAAAGTNLAGLKALLYRRVIRHVMNRTVAGIRAQRAGSALDVIGAEGAGSSGLRRTAGAGGGRRRSPRSRRRRCAAAGRRAPR